MSESTAQYPPIPPDDLSRTLVIAQPSSDPTLAHFGVVGDTYTITVSGDQTADCFCVIDMHIPPGGGPPPHRHDFEETFILLEGELEATFRGDKSIVRAGDTGPHSRRCTAPVPQLLLRRCPSAMHLLAGWTG